MGRATGQQKMRDRTCVLSLKRSARSAGLLQRAEGAGQAGSRGSRRRGAAGTRRITDDCIFGGAEPTHAGLVEVHRNRTRAVGNVGAAVGTSRSSVTEAVAALGAGSQYAVNEARAGRNRTRAGASTGRSRSQVSQAG